MVQLAGRRAAILSYRLGGADNTGADALAARLAAQDPYAILTFEGNRYLNPTSAAVQALDTAYANELLDACAFDGVHLSEEANEPFADHMEERLRQIGLQMDMESTEGITL